MTHTDATMRCAGCINLYEAFTKTGLACIIDDKAKSPRSKRCRCYRDIPDEVKK